MSEPMQPHKDGGLKQPPQTTPAPQPTEEIGLGGNREDALHDKDRVGGMYGDGEADGDE
jgi:hypothetical protein